MKTTAAKVIDQSYNLLATVMEEAYAGAQEDNLREAFVYRHGLTILRLGEDAIHLEAERKCHSSPIVVRSMLESLFNLVAGVKHANFAAEKVCWEIEEEVKRITKWLKPGASLNETIADLQNLGRTLKKTHGISNVRCWNTLNCAAAAELDQQYRTEYFLFSKKVHATQSGMISAEAEVGRGQVLQAICFVLICAAVHIVQLIRTNKPQEHIVHGTDLLEELNTLTRSGFFRDLGHGLAE
jgi:hypothetical protein